jgi:hypothetical protein
MKYLDRINRMNRILPARLRRVRQEIIACGEEGNTVEEEDIMHKLFGGTCPYPQSGIIIL